MDPLNFSIALHEKTSFEAILDNVCSRLQDRQALYSIRRLDELDIILGEIETELDVLVRGLPLSGNPADEAVK